MYICQGEQVIKLRFWI